MRGTTKKTAFALFRKGVHARNLPITDSWAESDDWFRQAIEDDTGKTLAEALDLRVGYPRAWAWMAYGRALIWLEDGGDDSLRTDAIAYARLAVEIDPFDYDTHWVAAFVELVAGDAAKAKEHMDEAFELVEEDHNLHLLNEMADVLVWLGKPAMAYRLLKKTRRTTDWNRWSMAWSLYFKGKTDTEFYKKALTEAESTFWQPGDDRYEDDIQLLIGVIAKRLEQFHTLNGNNAEALAMQQKSQAAMAIFNGTKPGWTIAKELHRMPFASSPKAQEAKGHWVEGLQEVGLV